jgi:hypothetical protein
MLGRNKAASNAVAQLPTASPTSQEFASLKSLIESVSFDGSTALEDCFLFATVQGLSMVGRKQELGRIHQLAKNPMACSSSLLLLYR